MNVDSFKNLISSLRTYCAGKPVRVVCLIVAVASALYFLVSCGTLSRAYVANSADGTTTTITISTTSPQEFNNNVSGVTIDSSAFRYGK